MKDHWVHLSIRQLGILLPASHACKEHHGGKRRDEEKADCYHESNPSQTQARLFPQQIEVSYLGEPHQVRLSCS